MKRKIMVRRRCRTCLRYYMTDATRSFYCSPECKKIGVQKREKARKRIYKSRDTRVKPEPKNKRLREAAARARELGMSYGQYKNYVHLHNGEEPHGNAVPDVI